MNKKTFLNEIKTQFSFLSKDELAELMHDYEEHFEAGNLEGRSEEEIAASLGEPRMLAKQFRAEFLIQEAKKNTTAGNLARAILSAVALGLFNIIIMLGPIMAVFGILIALFAMSLAFLGSGIAISIASIPMFSGLFSATLFVGGIALSSFGMILFIITLAGGKLFASLLIRYLQKNVEIIKNQ